MSNPLRGCVIGSPIEHSLSPLLHREVFKLLKIEGSYTRTEVTSGSLDELFANAHSDLDYFSITMPLKEEALNLPVTIDPIATRIQSANCLFRKEDGWHLTSTDGSGFISALKHKGHEKFSRALVLGAGGTARAVVGALDGVAQEIVVLGRTSTRRDVLESAISHSKFEYQRWSDTPEFEKYDLVVNTTPAGAADLLAESLIAGGCKILFDVIYKPWPTVLASRWHDSGGEVINGLELLMYQGIQQLGLALSRNLDEESLAANLRPVLQKAIV